MTRESITSKRIGQDRLASIIPAAVQRKAIEASRQRFTLRVTCRMVPFMFSMMLVQARERRRSVGRPRRTTHRISSSPQDGGGDAGPLLVQPPRQVPDQLLGPPPSPRPVGEPCAPAPP